MLSGPGLSRKSTKCGACTSRSIPIPERISPILHNSDATACKSGDQSGFLAGRPGGPADPRRLILLAGDVEQNPGPRWPCGYCGANINNRDYSIRCVDCTRYIHRKCLGWDVETMKAHDKYRWHCGCTPEPAPLPRPEPRTTKRIRILQLNVDGWRSKEKALKKLTHDTAADVLVLQETKLTESAKVPVDKDWTVFREDRKIHRKSTDGERAQGGVAIAVRPGIDCMKIETIKAPTGSALESVAVKIRTQTGWMEITNVYRPPAKTGATDNRDASPYLDKWPTNKNCVICSDINAHGSWDRSHQEDEIGDQVDEWMLAKGMCLLNSGAPTRMSKVGRGSAPDITVVHASRAHCFNWTTLESIGSDHYPILIATTERASVQRNRPKFNFKKADWGEFTRILEESSSLRQTPSESLEKAEKDFVAAVLDAAKGSVPVTTRGNIKPWWTPECETAKRKMNRCENEVHKHPGDVQLQERAKEAVIAFRKVVENSKRQSWRDFAAELSPRDPTSRVWNVIREMDGRGKQRLPNTPIYEDGKNLSSDMEKASFACRSYAATSRYLVRREDTKRAYEVIRDAVKDNEDRVNAPFSLPELKQVLRDMKPKAAGPDEIHPLMLKHLGEAGQQFLLYLINRSWEESRVCSTWRTALIVPILKKKKPSDRIKSYRPVSLLSCVSKCMETMVQWRISDWAWRNKIVPNEQAGFQPKRSTTDVIANIVQSAMDALQEKKRTLLVAVDFRAAFDRVWRNGLLLDLALLGLRGRCLRWLRAWLSDRRAAVRWNEEKSKPKLFAQGMPQGSPLSSLLYCLSTSNLPEAIKSSAPEVMVNQFADDLTLQVTGRKPEDAATGMQKALDSVTEWSRKNYVEIAVDKTAAMVISVDPRETAGKVTPDLKMLNESTKASHTKRRRRFSEWKSTANYVSRTTRALPKRI